MKRIILAITCLAIISCNSNTERGGAAENTSSQQREEKPVNNSLANEGIKEKVKSHSIYTYPETNGRVDSTNFTTITTYYNKEGFATRSENFEVTDGHKQLISWQEFVYKKGLLESIIEKGNSQKIVKTTNVVITGNKQILTSKDPNSQIAEKYIYILNSSFAIDTMERIIFNKKGDVEMSGICKYEYSSDGTRQRIILIPKRDGIVAGMEYYSFYNFEILEKDNVGNLLRYTSTLDFADGDKRIEHISCSYEYY